MKIVFLIPYASVGGGIRVIGAYANELIRRGHDVWIVSQPFKPHVSLTRRIKIMLGHGKMPQRPDGAPFFDTLGPRHIVLDRIGQPRPQDLPDADVIIATWWETAEWVAAMPASKGRKFYLLQGYEVFANQPRDRVVATYHLPLRKIAVSDYIRSEIAKHQGVHDIALVHNGIDVAHFDAPRRALTGAPTVGFVYTSLPIKNVARAIAAINLARRSCPALLVIAFGNEDIQPDLPLPDRTDYYQSPPQEAIPGLYASCDAWLFSSDSEGFGLPMLEAMACRTPIIATPAGAAPDLITGANGWLIDHDTAQMAKRIVSLSTLDQAEWETMSDAAHDTAQRHSWDRAMDQFLDILMKE